MIVEGVPHQKVGAAVGGELAGLDQADIAPQSAGAGGEIDSRERVLRRGASAYFPVPAGRCGLAVER